MIVQQARGLRGGLTRKRTSLLVAGSALAAFVGGALFAAEMPRPAPTANADRVFELMIYHTKPGQATALESVFRNSWKLQAKHHLHVLGYWVPNGDPAWNDTFVYLIAHPSRAEAEAHWKEFHADPAFPPLRKLAAPLIQQVNGEYRVDEIYMRPSDFSALK